MMEELKLAQFHNLCTQSKEKKREILKKVHVQYCIPDRVIDINKWQYSGYTSLHFAAESSIVDLDLINELIEQGSDLLKQGTKYGCTPIHAAFDESSFIRTYPDKLTRLQKCSLINALLSKQVEMKNILNPKSLDGTSHFHIACAVNHAEAVEFFVKAREHLNQPINSNCKLPGYTPLHCAIKYSCIEVAEILLRHGADVDLKNANGMSSVHLLVHRCMDTTDLMKVGKRTLCVPYEQEVERFECIIKLVLKARASNGIFVDDSGLSALHVACILRDKSTVEEFLKQNIDVNLPVKSESKFWPGWTPLHFAACCNVETMMLLMQRGADITMKNSKGATALDLCAKRFAPSDIRVILSTSNEFKDILMSDSCTKLLDLLLVMNDYKKFSDFLQNLKDVNITIPLNSPIWPGYNLLHLSVSLNEKTKCRKLSEEIFYSPESAAVNPERYNCTEDEQALYSKRIELLSKYGCSTSMKNADGKSPIHLAFGMLSQATVERLLRCDEENAVDQNGMSHLHIACADGDVGAVLRYVGGGADVNARTGVDFDWHNEWRVQMSIRANSTPLHVAVLFRNHRIVRYLLAKNADVHATDSLGFTPIHLSTYDIDLARSLLDATTPNSRDSVSAAGLSHLHVAAWADHCEAVEQLLLGGAELDRVVGTDVEQFPFLEDHAGKTPLLLAFQDDRSRAFEALLRAGANPCAEDLKGDCPLRDALLYVKSHKSSQQLIRMLRESGESHDVESAGMTLLHVACASCDVDWAERLLAQGADVDARVRGGEPDGATPLYLVLNGIDMYHEDSMAYSPRRRFALVELLVNRGADVTIESCGSTPICRIYRSTCNDDGDRSFAPLLRAADLLVRSQKSYRVNPVDERGFSHFHFACARNDVETATKFLDHGVDVNRSTDPFDYHFGGSTPLHFAMAHKSTEVAHLLLERGADVNAEDAHGNTPLHVAFEKRFVNLPLIEPMMRCGADVHAKNLSDDTLLHILMGFDDLTSDKYLNVIERTGIDGCLYQRDVDGNTPLHVAMNRDNLEAVKALLRIGVDISEINHFFFFSNFSNFFIELREKVAKALASHIWKMRFIRLDVANSNLRFLEAVEQRFSLVTLLEQPCQHELTKAQKTEIYEGVTVNDYLSELGAAAAYPRLHPIRRAIVDKFFKCTADLHREFPEFCGLLALQYRKALVRVELMQPAKEAIASIFEVKLPDLCSEAVLGYFTNSEMNIVIEVAEEL